MKVGVAQVEREEVPDMRLDSKKYLLCLVIGYDLHPDYDSEKLNDLPKVT